METFKTLSLVLAGLSFVVMIGGGTYEHAGVVPVWSAAVPASLTMYQGEYAIEAARFWMPIHPITLLLFIVALVSNWRTPRRRFILVPLLAYVAILVTTFLWFVPELMAITQSAFSTAIDAELTQRAGNWERLSLIRLAFLLLMAVILLFGLSRSAKTSEA
jgi:hypothetical protein